MSADPYSAPTDEPPELGVNGLVLFGFGLVTLGYSVLTTGCCMLPAMFVLAGDFDPEMTSIDRGMTLVCSVLYAIGIVPAIAGLARSQRAVLLHVVWGAAVLVAEALASVAYLFSHTNGIGMVILSALMFCVWPLACVVLLPLAKR